MDSRTKQKIKSYNNPNNSFKLKARKNGDFYSLYTEIQKDGIRKKKTLNIIVTGKTNHYLQDKKQIDIAMRIVEDYNRKYKEKKNIDFLTNLNDKSKYLHLDFYKFFQNYYEDKYSKSTTRKPFQNTLTHLKKFSGKKTTIESINKNFCFQFKNYLDKTDLKNSSKNTYLQKFKEVVLILVDEKKLIENPFPKKYSFKPNTPDRQYLTEAELKLLIQTDYPDYSFDVCNAFIFSCLTGLRWGDLEQLKFSDIKKGVLKIKQGKTKEFVEFDLPNRALKIVGTMKTYNQDFIFENIGSNTRGNKKIKEWVDSAGIDKVVTWHVARHTFACLLILKNVDLYHISKLLGHTDIKHTMKYLHLIKEHKAKATNVLSEI